MVNEKTKLSLGEFMNNLQIGFRVNRKNKLHLQFSIKIIL